MDKDKKHTPVWAPDLMDLIAEFANNNQIKEAPMLAFFMTQTALIAGSLFKDEASIDTLLKGLKDMVLYEVVTKR